MEACTERNMGSLSAAMCVLDRHRALIVMGLMDGTKRFGELVGVEVDDDLSAVDVDRREREAETDFDELGVHGFDSSSTSILSHSANEMERPRTRTHPK